MLLGHGEYTGSAGQSTTRSARIYVTIAIFLTQAIGLPILRPMSSLSETGAHLVIGATPSSSLT
jgi:hypothetical protein